MSFSVLKLDKQEWGSLAEKAHFVSFGEKRPYALERVDYALLLVDSSNVPAAWISCHELDSETVYWQYGGAGPQYAKTVHVLRGYTHLIGWAKERYKRISTRIENKNTAMLKLALQIGFVVVGTRVANGKVFVELMNEFEKDGG